ncbi:MAG: transcriptional regulator [Amycolatopsis sp.]|jgi:AcrR family transcriptional regulator|uniref:TetR/AcrR family transcriptional regulator n=1 Tax=Amycolatopsis sp. TaxID=37632 RepID=UPI002606BDD1|nr:TetR/AcrR family transcriptional regulator [Amycolatopsis sp.]MCU1680892.1 transcriptional regulator [Amycolatopsis sp.]
MTTSADGSRPTSSRGPYAKGLAKRAEILRVALEAYAKAGSAGPTLKSIAESVQLTEAGVLHYFGSKDELLVAILQARDASASERYDLTTYDGVFDYLNDVVRTPGLARLFVEMTAAASQPDHPAAAFMEDHAKGVRELITTLLGREDDSAARILLAVTDGLQIQWLRDPTLDVLADIRRTVDLFVTSQTTDPSREGSGRF